MCSAKVKKHVPVLNLFSVDDLKIRITFSTRKYSTGKNRFIIMESMPWHFLVFCMNFFLRNSHKIFMKILQKSVSLRRYNSLIPKAIIQGIYSLASNYGLIEKTNQFSNVLIRNSLLEKINGAKIHIEKKNILKKLSLHTSCCSSRKIPLIQLSHLKIDKNIPKFYF